MRSCYIARSRPPFRSITERTRSLPASFHSTSQRPNSFTQHEPQTTNDERRTTNHESRTTNHEPRTTNHEPRTTNHERMCTTSGSPVRRVDALEYMTTPPASTITRSTKSEPFRSASSVPVCASGCSLADRLHVRLPTNWGVSPPAAPAWRGRRGRRRCRSAARRAAARTPGRPRSRAPVTGRRPRR